MKHLKRLLIGTLLGVVLLASGCAISQERLLTALAEDLALLSASAAQGYLTGLAGG